MADQHANGDRLDTSEGTQGPQIEGTLSIQEAGAFYGVAEKTIRRRIKTGALRAVQHTVAEGFEWRVYPEGTHRSNGTVQAPQQGTHTLPEAGTLGTQVDPSIAQALELIERMHEDQSEELERLRRDNQQLAGQVGFLQAKLQSAEEQIRLLSAPKDEPVAAPEPAPVQRAPWWKRLLR